MGMQNFQVTFETRTLLILIVGEREGGSNCKFWEKTPQAHLIIITE